jgi:hypothetical protein
LIGALVGSGIPEERARVYEREIRAGSILISLLPRTETEAAQIERLFQDAGGELVLR